MFVELTMDLNKGTEALRISEYPWHYLDEYTEVPFWRRWLAKIRREIKGCFGYNYMLRDRVLRDVNTQFEFDEGYRTN